MTLGPINVTAEWNPDGKTLILRLDAHATAMSSTDLWEISEDAQRMIVWSLIEGVRSSLPDSDDYLTFPFEVKFVEPPPCR